MARRAAAMTALLVLLSACSAEVAGVYRDHLGTVAYDFRPEQRVYITVLDVTVAGDYATDGARIIVTGPQGTIVFERDEDRLIGPTGQVLLRAPNSRWSLKPSA